jgi:phage major head subunit gpT-like protein
MSISVLSSRGIIGEFYRTLEQDVGAPWMNLLSVLFTSDQDSEDYKWIGQSPAMREWVGGRHAKGFIDNGLTIENKHYESTLEFFLKDLRRDKTGQIMVRIQEFAAKANVHWATLISALIINGESSACYDGQYFFDTDHSEGDSGAQSNDIQVDISALPATTHGAVTAPSNEEMQQAILKTVAQIQGFVDDRGEPINEVAQNFLVMVPTSLAYIAQNALATPRGTAITEELPVGMNINVVTNARLSSWTDKFAVFRTDGRVKPFIRQQETDVKLKVKAEGSDFEFDNDAHQYGIDTWRNVGYGMWQHACMATMV